MMQTVMPRFSSPWISGGIVAQTNLYAMQLQQKLGHQDKQWTATTVDEIRAYLEIRIFMSVLQLPAMEMINIL
jgi:hypothetical protein